MSEGRISAKEKIKAVKLYLDGKVSQRELARRYGVKLASVQQWIWNYESSGEEVFLMKGQRRYSQELKLQAVMDYLYSKDSLTDICKKYRIRSKGRLQIWIKRHNGGKMFKSTGTGGITMRTKGRTTTFDERVAIVEYCISHGRNYAQAAEKFQISYQQARNYVLKYEADGVDGLKDRRGRSKPIEEMSEVERLRAENRMLRAEKERSEMEVRFLKKLAEIERRRG